MRHYIYKIFGRLESSWEYSQEAVSETLYVLIVTGRAPQYTNACAHARTLQLGMKCSTILLNH